MQSAWGKEQRVRNGRKHMRKFVIRILLCAMLSALCLPVQAAQPAKIPLIGVLGSGIAADPRNKAGLDAVRDGLREFGYTEGKTISFEHRFA
jgi:hypothetical protein